MIGLLTRWRCGLLSGERAHVLDVDGYPASWLTVTFIRCVYLFTASYGVSYGPIGWVLPSEVFPQSVRSKGVALSTASNWCVIRNM